MVQTPTKYERYLADFRALEQAAGVNGATWLHELRSRAFARFHELGFPTARRGNEKWKYTDVRPIAEAVFEYPLTPPQRDLALADITPLLPWDPSWTTIVFLDGHYAPSLSSADPAQGVQVTSLTEALASDGVDIEQHLARYASPDDDAFIALNTAFLRDGAFIAIPDGSSPAAPLHIVFITTERGHPSVSYPRVLLLAGQHTNAIVLESYLGLASSRYLTNAVTEIVLGEGAELHHYRYLRESPDAFHIANTKVYQGRDSRYTSTAFAMGCAIARHDLHAILDAPGAYCNLLGLYMVSGTQHIDNALNIDHLKPHGTSHQYYKGILAGKSRAVFSGRVIVHRDAQKTFATQEDKNLVLSNEAEVDTKPSLEIYADDVQVTHGATAGQFEEDAVFYLQSRGIDLETASRLLINAFASEIIDTIQLEPLRAYLHELTSSSLPDFQFK